MPIEREIILLVDDDREFLAELQEALALSGFIPVAVTNGADALRTARRIRPDVMLLDFKLGTENGFTIARKIRKDPATSRIPVIMMSGYFSASGREASLAPSSINVYLNKPFTQSDVVRSIQAVLANTREAAEKRGDLTLMKQLLIGKEDLE